MLCRSRAIPSRVNNPHLRQAKARVGERAGKYTLERLIDLGGMAAVYEARHWRVRVAVKVLHRSYMRMPNARERFAREGYAANRVQHADVVNVMGHGQLADGSPFFVMDLLRGCSLEQHLEVVHTMTPEGVLWLADRVLDVLVAAHDKGVIHRDIKPGNVFLTEDGAVKVLDFGLARLLDGGVSHSLTRTGTVIGTAAYMSPEQALRKPELIDPLTDVWSVGAIMFRCLAGRTVHAAEGTARSLIAAATKPAPALTTVLAEVPQQVARVVDGALAFQKQERWSDASAMQLAVRQAYQDLAQDKDSVPVQLSQEELNGEPTGLSESEVPVSVTFSELSGGDSIVVEFDDGSGHSERFKLKRRDGLAPSSDLSSYEVVLDEILEDDSLEDNPTKKHPSKKD